MKLHFVVALMPVLGAAPAMAQNNDQSIKIVAAENFYGDIAQQLAGDSAQVTSVLSNPDEDPHLFEASPSVARDLASAKIVIYNGVDYDPWMAKLVAANKSPGRHVIVAGELLHKKTGVNPHLWYDPPTAPAVAKAITAALVAQDPAHKSDYERRLQSFTDSLRPITMKVTEIRKSASGISVTATEPVFGYMAAALGFKMRNERFQLAVMNNTEPTASDVAAFENDLKLKRVKLFFYNSQASDSAAQRLLKMAQDNQIPVIGVTETLPPGKTFQQWMEGELDAVEKVLPGGA
ncbi:MAG: zinc ABC transporter substrate-binding protein [Hyphomicrobiales bacterium]|nr:zinc ABC transporter substrate-binding protein [Hyphomicrobiales bacterium]